MATKISTTPGVKTKPGAVKKTTPKQSQPKITAKTTPKKSLPVRKGATVVKAPPVDTLKKSIAYFYLLSFCPPMRIADFYRSTAAMRKALAKSAGMSEAAYFKMIIPEVCRRIVAFHQNTREPSQHWIDALVNTAQEAHKNPAKTQAFQVEMSRVARLPQRAKPEGRLHRKKGCALCRLPCFYGYFTLVSDPQFGQLQAFFTAEANRSAAEQNPLNPIYGFTFDHITSLTGTEEGYLFANHMVNLSYCLLLLGMAKSRQALPEEQLRMLQETNREFILRTRAGTYIPAGPGKK